MTLLRVNPVKDFENIHNNLQRYFEDFSSVRESSNEEYIPRVDVSQDEKNIFIEAEIPGVKKGDIKVSVKNNILTVEGEKNKPNDEEGVKWFRTERVFGAFKRSFTLPKNTDTNSIEAKHENGTLNIKLNKIVPKEAELKEIKIN